ncbi:MAG: metallophosphoesterase [Planctomycetes bacterium]|nr:metallophosphoesterase [Planctomycetota bacterium]
MSEKHVFVSDLHLFSRRSHAHLLADDLYRAAAGARTFVLGGDIFDFCWTTLPSVSHTVEAALAWLRRLVEPHPECEFHFILGNHDANRRFTRLLPEFTASVPNFAWHPYYVRLGGSLFLHGDVAEGAAMDHERLNQYRARWCREHKHGPVANRVYDAAVAAHLHRAIGTAAHPTRRVVRRLATYAERMGHGLANGLRHVYFGHTHSAMAGYRYGGLAFHNGGAPMRGLRFRIVDAVV